MSNTKTLPSAGIKKLYVSETVFFAINNIPAVDQSTLEKFLELVNATGTFGVLSHEQILTKMRLTLRYIPRACPRSLDILAELLEIPMAASFSNQLRDTPVPLALPQAGFNSLNAHQSLA